MQLYRLIRGIAAGGMGEVYEGRKLSNVPMDTPHPVAIKLISHQEHPENERDAANLFRREGPLSWRITHEHSNLVTTYDYGISANGRGYLVMELVDGPSVRDVSKDKARLDYSVIRRIVRDTLNGLEHLHKRGVIHRDITARNIMLSRTGEVKIIDFGLIKESYASVSERFHGTVACAAPEALQGRRLGPLADLYSLGVVLYQLLVGCTPYGSNMEDVVDALDETEGEDLRPLPDDTPDDIAALVSGLMALKPGEREWSQAVDVLAFIKQQGEPVANDEALRALVAARAPKDEALILDVELPELGWPFDELPIPSSVTPVLAPSPADARRIEVAGRVPSPPSAPVQASRRSFTAWAPLGFAAGLAVFVVAFMVGNMGHESRDTQEPRTRVLLVAPENAPETPRAKQTEVEEAERTESPRIVVPAVSSQTKVIRDDGTATREPDSVQGGALSVPSAELSKRSLMGRARDSRKIAPSKYTRRSYRSQRARPAP